MYLSYSRICSLAASTLSSVVLCFCLLTTWAESFDYIPGENQQFRAILELFRCSTTKGKAWCSSQAEWRRLLPPAPWPGPGKPCFRCLPWNRAAQSSQDASTAEIMCRIYHKAEIYVKVGGKCGSAVTQVKARALPIYSALHCMGLLRLQSALSWLQRELPLEFWPGSRQDERD